MLNTYVKAFAVAILATSAAAGAQSVKGTIALPGLPEQLAVNPISNRVYVAVPNFGAEPYDTLSVVDGHTDAVIQNIEIPPVAYAVAVDPFRCLVYVGGTYVDASGVSQNEVVVVNARTNTVQKTIAISTMPGNGIQGIAVNEATGILYVSNGSDNELDVVQNLTVQQRISLGAQPFGVAVNPLVGNVYVALVDGNVSIINAKTNQITVTTPFGTSDAGIAVNLLTGNVYVANSVSYPESGSVGALNQSGTLEATIPAGYAPLGIDVDFGTNLIFVANSQSNTVGIINGKTNAVTATLPVSSLFLAVNPVTQKVYVAPSANTPILTVVNEK